MDIIRLSFPFRSFVLDICCKVKISQLRTQKDYSASHPISVGKTQ
jgi:hypothetical protein